jgi:hypothetical protein
MKKIKNAINNAIDSIKFAILGRLAQKFYDVSGEQALDYSDATTVKFGIFIPICEFPVAHDIRLVGEEDENNG